MSRTVDERIVSMHFDNRQFESNVQTSLGTLDKLKQSLRLTEAAQGLDNVSAAAKGIDLSSIGNGVEIIRSKFSSLQVMAITALANITNSAVNTGKRLVSAFTIDPIKTGLEEYETQINAVQTILANTQSKGTTLTDVNSALDELNRYADMTIYNFTEMTRNIGTFTAAGVELDTSVSAIKGIANLAAVSGSNSQQASTAMYQLSQAISSGTVKLMDWNSVVNAGMGGQVFQDALKDTARVHGINIDAMIDKEGSFRETLQNGWLSSEILLETLNKFTGDLSEEQLKSMGYTQEQIKEIMKLGQTANDAATKVKTFTQLMDTLKEAAQSGWTQTWEILIGDFEQAKELWTNVSDIFSEMINSSSEARNNMLQGWADGGGREMVIESIKNMFEGLTDIIKPITEAFREIFPPTTSDQLIKITEAFRNFTEKLTLSDSQSAKLKSTFKGLFSVLDIVCTVIKEVVGGFVSLLGNITGLCDGLLNITGSIGDWLIGLRNTIKETDIIGQSVHKVTGFLQQFIDRIKDVYSLLKEKLTSPGFEGFLETMQSIGRVMAKIGEKIKEVGSSIGNALTESFRGGDFSTLLDIFSTGVFASILLSVKKFIDGLSGTGGILNGIVETLDSVRGCFEAYQQNLQAKTLLTIASAIGILTAAIVVLSLINPEKLNAALGAITVLFANLIGAMALFNKIGGLSKGVLKSSAAMIAMSTSILILASALVKIADLSWEELAKGLTGVLGLTAIVVAASKILSSGNGDVMKGATQMVIMAAALKILASVCQDLSTLSWEELGKGLAGVGILLAELLVFMKLAEFSGGKTITTATGIVILAAAINILASACGDFGQMQWEEIGKGLTAVGILLAEITLFTKLTGNAEHVISTGVALIAIAAAMKIFASAIGDLGSMSWDELAKGLTGIAGALLAVTLAVNFMPKNMVSVGVGLIAVSAALVILSDALIKMGDMSWEEIAKGLVALGGSMTILAVGLNVMNGTLTGSAALLVATSALAILAPVLKSLGGMSWEEIAKGLVSIAGVFTVLGVAGLLLGPLTPIILSLSGAVALFGLGCLAVGVGVLALSTGLTALSATVVAASAAIVAALSIIFVGILDLIPTITDRITDVIVALCEVIIRSAPALGEAINVLILEIINVLVTCVPPLVDGLLVLLVRVFESLVEHTPKLVALLFDFLVAVFNGVAERLPELIQAAMNVIMAFFTGCADAISGIDTDALLKGIVGVGLLAGLMLALAGVASLVPGALTGVAGMGLVLAALALVIAAIGALAQLPGLEWLINEGGEFLQRVGNAIGKFIGGIVGGVAEGITASLPQMGTDLSNFMNNLEPFVEGAKSIDASSLEGAKMLAQLILTLTAANLLESMTSWLTGSGSMTEFASQLIPFGQAMTEFSYIVSGNIDEGAVMAAANAGKIMAEMAATIPNTGGVAGWFAGENDMYSFGEQLKSFGKAIVEFSSTVSGKIDEGAVTAAATAGKILVEIANAIPNTGGMVSWFSGDNDMQSFGKQLKAFGTALCEFSSSVSGVDIAAITIGVTASKKIFELSTHAPTGGLFFGGVDVATFKKQLISFAKAVKEFASEISGVDGGQIASDVAELKTALQSLKGVSDSSVTEFVNGFSSSGPKVSSAITNMLDSALNTISNKKNAFVNSGKNFVDDFIKSFTNTFSSSGPNISKSITDIIKSAIDNITSKKKSFMDSGKALITEFINGIESQKTKPPAAVKQIMTNVLSEVKSKDVYSGFQSAGANCIQGFANGINANTFKATAQAKAMALAAKNAAEKVLDIHSPSRVFYEIGSNVGLGFTNALHDHIPMVQNISSALFGSAVNVLEDKPRVFEELGVSSVEGFITGIKSLGTSIKMAMSETFGVNEDELKIEFGEDGEGYRTALEENKKLITEMHDNVDEVIKTMEDRLASYRELTKDHMNKITTDSEITVADMIENLKHNQQALSEWADSIASLAERGLDKGFLEELRAAGPKAIGEVRALTEATDKELQTLNEVMGRGGEVATEALVRTIGEGASLLVEPGQNLTDALAQGLLDSNNVNDAMALLIERMKTHDTEGIVETAKDTGKCLVEGFANGISTNTFAVEASAKAMAEAAAEAARKVLDIHSPSRVGYKIGGFFGIGFVNAIGDSASRAYNASSKMAKTAVRGLSGALSKAEDLISESIDTQPTVRPILDLSDVTSGVDTIQGLLGMTPSVGILSNIGMISALMNRRQNGVNNDVVSAIKRLEGTISNISGGDRYTIGDIVYDDGSNISDAVQSLVRAARVERRM